MSVKGKLIALAASAAFLAATGCATQAPGVGANPGTHMSAHGSSCHHGKCNGSSCNGASCKGVAHCKAAPKAPASCGGASCSGKS